MLKLKRITPLLLILMIPVFSFCQETDSNHITYNNKTYQLYPTTLVELPDIFSPITMEDRNEVVLVETKEGKYAIVSVTVENGEPLLYSGRIKSQLGKDRQLKVDIGDFPELAKTGLHNEMELVKKERITGLPVSIITVIGRPNGFSYSGFMAKDEDIISV
ncbi:MAG: hypothetical protein KAT38_05335 [Bacteroidales bacterium]|nr:hypothetical protein [Bacteroidales bacterium]